jgi:ribosomal protein L2
MRSNICSVRLLIGSRAASCRSAGHVVVVAGGRSAVVVDAESGRLRSAVVEHAAE